MRVLDTDILVDVLRSYAPAEAWLSSLTEQPAVCGLVVMELVRGCFNKADLSRVLRLTQAFPTFWPSDADCAYALSEYVALRLSSGIGVMDMLIAATPVGRGAALVTFNRKHFSIVPNLTTEQPYERA